MRALRPSYFASRILLAGLAILFMLMASDPLIRILVVQSVQRVTGAKVDLSRVRSSILKGHVQLVDLQVADPYRPHAESIRSGSC